MGIHTYCFDGVNTGKFKRIPYREAQKREQALEPKSYKFNSDFWEKIRVNKKSLFNVSIIKSLERVKRLDKQFRRNGKD